jgi:hypothetical protein
MKECKDCGECYTGDKCTYCEIEKNMSFLLKKYGYRSPFVGVKKEKKEEQMIIGGENQ